MRIIFIRHGEPNYEKDCLTPRGQLQAEAVSKRLVGENIDIIYASPLGRAQETASYTSKRLNLPVHTLDFMHEVTWGGEDIPMGAHPWILSDAMIDREDFDFFKDNWTEHPFFKTNFFMNCCNKVNVSIDEFLKQEGYEHIGRRFQCTKENDSTIAIFSHGGSGGCAISHILGLPFPYVASVFPFDFTSVSVIEFPNRVGDYVHPQLMLVNDMQHTEATLGGPKRQKKADQT